MSFILIIRKQEGFNGAERFNSKIDAEYLDSKSATTYLSQAAKAFRLDRAHLWYYDHGSEIPSEPVLSTEQGLYFLEGNAVSLRNRKTDAKSLYGILSEDRKTDDIQGDFLVFGISKEGSGTFFSSLMSFNRLFSYEDEDLVAYASEIKLIFNGIRKFRSGQLLDHYDFDFLADSMINEWGEREFPQSTFLKDIKRVPSTSFLKFTNFRPVLEDCQYKSYDSSWGELYLENKTQFYEKALHIINATNKAFLNSIAGKPVELLISGGLDSRLNAAILSSLAPGFDIKLNTKSWGPADHPDVVIGSLCAEVLNLPFFNQHGEGKLFYPRELKDYQDCLKISQGDWNSNDWRTSDVFIRRIVVSGQDNYKRHNWKTIFGMNRWYAARMAYTKTLPILSLSIVNKMALVYSKHNYHEGLFEFAHELLKRFAPSLLEVPLVGMSIPQHFIKPYGTVAESKTMPSREVEAYFDSKLVNNLMKTVKSDYFHKRISAETVHSKERYRRIIMDYSSMQKEDLL